MSAITSKNIALAAEALNRAPGLSPLARRLGIELLGRMDRKTGRCKPSETRLALSLGCDERSIRRAKVELKAAGFLSWVTPGRYSRPVYQLMISRLADLALQLKDAIRKAVTPQVLKVVHQQRVKARKAQEALQNAVRAGRTKMSGSLTPLVNHSFKAKETDRDAHRRWRAKAESTFWQDVREVPNGMELAGRLTEKAFERIIAAEMASPGSGIGLLALEGGPMS